MDEHERARHDEAMAAYAATISRARADTAQAEADQARTGLRGKEVDIAQAKSRRFAAAFEASAMESAVRRADLHAAFTGWPSWASRHDHHGIHEGER